MNPLILDPKTTARQKPEIECNVNQKVEYKFMGTMKMIPGLKLWKYDVDTYELSEVEINKTKDVTFDKRKVTNDKVLYNPRCLYFQALNRKNAERHLDRIVKAYEKVTDESK